MKKKNGFISMALVYTFLILFMFIMLAILRTYTEKDKFLQAINEQIDNDIGVAKGARVTVISRLLEDNMPSSDSHIHYYKISNSSKGNGNGFYYMDKKSYKNTNYNIIDYTDEDDNGYTSKIYYFRGNVENNHIIFANMCFRIIRTNEDGSIRIVYNGLPYTDSGKLKCKTLSNTDFDSISIGNAKFNNTLSVNYIAPDASGSIPEADVSNEQSPIISILDHWYSSHFLVNDTNTVNFSEYINKNTFFCNNKESYKSSSFYKSRELSPEFINKDSTDPYDDDNIQSFISFKCAGNNDRFDIVSGKLLFPIGLLTAQDIVLAGGYLDIGDKDVYKGGADNATKNTDFYLYNPNSYWTMSPLSNDGKVIYFDGEGVLKGANATESYGIRPVISLNSNIVISKGDGTSNNPYVVRTSN